ncbi:HPP family protein [Streptosporangium sandarakinum]|uniref:HPP family protein n=1 Tax=Streptosporangium sandarakinum TaxID=1260955 RepID=UPI00379FB678
MDVKSPSDVRDLTVGRVMSRTLVAVDPDESPLLAWEIMRRAGVHHLPIVDGDRRLVGVLTREDITARWSGGPAEQSRVRVQDLIAGHRCPRISARAPLREAAAAMIGAGTAAVPVLGESGTIVGMVTTTDILRAVAGRIAEETGEGEPPELMTGMFRLVPVLPHDSWR